MRLCLSVLLLSLAVGPAVAQTRPSPPGAKAACPGAPSARYAAVLRDKAPAARTLDREPPGKLILTVQREVNGCPELAVVRSNIGASRFEPAPEGK